MSADKKSNYFQQGVFSSLSSLNIGKRQEDERKTVKRNVFARQVDRRTTSSPSRPSRSPQKGPTQSPQTNQSQPKNSRSPSPIRLQPEAPKEDLKAVKTMYESKILKLQETMRSLNLTINKDKRHIQKLEADIKVSDGKLVEEIKVLRQDNQSLLTMNKRLKAGQKAIIAEQNKLAADLGNSEAKVELCQTTIHELAFTLVECLEGVLISNQSQSLESSFETPGEAESEEKKLVFEQIKSQITNKLTTCVQATGSDLQSQIARVGTWKPKNSNQRRSHSDYIPLDHRADSLNNTTESEDALPPVPVISYTVDYFDKAGDAKEYAVALFDFEGEREGDLFFKQGDVIEIVEKDDSGWWMGTIGEDTGIFPSNFVQL